MPSLDDWLEFVPYSPPLPEGRLHHVALTFRAVDRPWTLLLQESLQYAGFHVRLDQVSWPADAPRSTCLDRGLVESAAGSLVLTERDPDSPVFRAEHEALLRGVSDHGLLYVPVLRDGVEPPATSLPLTVVRFDGARECPGGEGLVRLAFALLDEPLPDASVAFAREVDRERAEMLAEIHALENGATPADLLSVARTSSMAWISFPWARCRIVELLIEKGALEPAREVLSLIERDSPLNVRRRQLLAHLHLRRAELDEAEQLLEHLAWELPDDAETLQLQARVCRERFHHSQSLDHLRLARHHFAWAAVAWPEDWASLAHAAHASVLLSEPEVAKTFARSALRVLGAEPGAHGHGGLACAAEAGFVLGQTEETLAGYQKAFAVRPRFPWSARATRDRARQLLEALRPAAALRAPLDALLDSRPDGE